MAAGDRQEAADGADAQRGGRGAADRADPAGPETSWHLVSQAAAGSSAGREEFVRRYEPVVRAYLEARWRHPALRQAIDDAVQETFVDCLRRDGALRRADPSRPQRFRAYLYGVTRVVALRFERARQDAVRREPRGESVLEGAPSRQESFVRVFDRAYALAFLARASRLHEERAAAAGGPAWRRFELLGLRFREGLAIRDIAGRWDVDPAWLHHQYATAREEFKAALLEVARREYGSADAEARCARMLESLG